MGNPRRKASTAATSTTNEELHTAARSGDFEAVQMICSANPLAINSRDKHSRTPLHLAAWSGHAKVVEFLCKKVDVSAAAMDDMGAIHFAAQKGHLEIVKILITSGVSVKSSNRKGMTALHYASQGSHVELAKYLLKKGADLNAKNKAGKTPLDLAGNDEVRSVLVDIQKQSTTGVLNGRERVVEAKPSSSSQMNADNADEIVQVVVEKTEDMGEGSKRKSEEDNTKEILPGAKKSKVALNHLLAQDDTHEDEDV